MGIGFREREAAFDFKNCLNEYVRYVERMALAAKLAFESSAQSQEMQNTDRGDRSHGESNSVRGILVIMILVNLVYN